MKTETDSLQKGHKYQQIREFMMFTQPDHVLYYPNRDDVENKRIVRSIPIHV